MCQSWVWGSAFLTADCSLGLADREHFGSAPFTAMNSESRMRRLRGRHCAACPLRRQPTLDRGAGVVAFRRGDARRQRASQWGLHCEIPQVGRSHWALSRSCCQAMGRGLGWHLAPPSSILHHHRAGRAQDASPAVCREGARPGCAPLRGRDARLGWGRPVGSHPATPMCADLKSPRQRPERNVLLKCSRDHPHSSSRRHRCSADTS